MTIPKELMLRLAREQRATAVNAEAMMWRALRGRRLGGFKFRRQVPIGRYIADFVCFEARLIVEIDGPSHDADLQQKRDASRDQWLEQQGFRIMRLSNDLVIGSPELATQRVARALRDCAASPHPVGSADHLLPQEEKGE
ncbi:endonuclease domain-containing protein [Methylosinus sp. H3A]|uniref:endonuclease domain-containing protein n=1 Tax=Methylosinus sp. H3A TaxID=2785786 RepID=UPI001AEEEAA2|nr:endonuclease domain-containing protein [Methylosinus sp. H3A]